MLPPNAFYKLIISITATFYGAVSGFAQTGLVADEKNYATGYIFPDEDAMQSIPPATLKRSYIPEAIDLSDRFPPPGNQKAISSCAAWAVGYAARSYYSNTEIGVRGPQSIASPAYIYNRIYDRKDKSCAEAGALATDALKLLQTEGSFSLEEYGADAMCNPQQVKASSAPGKFLIKGFTRLASLPHEKLNIDVAKQSLAQGHPVIIGLKIDKAFMSLRPTEIYKGIPGGDWSDVKKLGGHAVVLVGYDERRRAFRLINSWDTTWADGGFGWIDQDALQAQAVNAFQIIPAAAPPKPAIARPVSPRLNIPPDIASLQCSDLQVSQDVVTVEGKENSVTRLTGFVSTSSAMRRLTGYAEEKGYKNDVKFQPWPLCEASLTLREPLRAGSRPLIALTGGNRDLKVNETFSFSVTPPDVPSFLYVFYIEDDGAVVNLAPRNGIIRKQVDPKSGPVIFGDGRSGRATFRVTPLRALDETGAVRQPGDPERGHEAVIAIAARAPIEKLEERETQEAEKKPGGKFYRVEAKAKAQDGSPDRLFLSLLKDIVLQRSSPDMLPREVSADVFHITIKD